MTLDLNPNDLALVKQILQTHAPDRRAFVFGSRVTGRATERSDLDICLMCDQALDFGAMARLQDAFSEALLDFRVDVIQWPQISSEFKDLIIKNAVHLF